MVIIRYFSDLHLEFINQNELDIFIKKIHVGQMNYVY
jgi:hypothetical protein